MKKFNGNRNSVLVLIFCVVFLVTVNFLLSKPQAQNKAVVENLIEGKSLFFAKQPDRLKEVPQMVNNMKSVGAIFDRRELFQPSAERFSSDKQLNKVLIDGTVFNLNRTAVQRVFGEDVKYLTLPLPEANGGSIELELVKVDIFAPGFSVQTAAPHNEQIDEQSLGIHYRGVVKGNDRSLVAISIYPNEVMGFYSTETDGNVVLGRLGGKNSEDRHILYADRNLKIRPDFHCDVKDDKDSDVVIPESLLREPEEIMARCIRIYIEADKDLFDNKGSVAGTTSYLTGMFNQSATIYSNDGIPISMSEVFVWNVQSPYAGLNEISPLLDRFQQYRNSFNGDFGHLVALRGNGGLAAGVNGFCNTNIDQRQCFSGTHPNYSTVPTYSWTVNVFTHEMGHLMGSRHTHACVWNGNNTAIDACGPSAPPVPGFPPITYEGTCSNAPLPPFNSGTIMSYCHLVSSVGMNFTLGFGSQPRALILNRFNAASCLTDCGMSPTPTPTPIPGGNTFPGTGVGPIPDNNSSGLVISFPVSGLGGAPTSIAVSTTLTHSWVGDLTATLRSPNGTTFPLYSRIGTNAAGGTGDDSDFSGTYIFTDTASGSIWTAAATAGSSTAIPSGSYRASAALTGAATNLTGAFSGTTQLNGTWTLTVTDNATSDTGSITAASLTLGGATPTPTPTPSPTSTPIPTPTPVSTTLQDGGFELNTGSQTVTNSFWASTSTMFGTSLCTVAACNTGSGAAAPRTGIGWVWFDGSGSGAVAENGTVQQSVRFPNGGTLTLNYYLRVGSVTAPSNSVLTVSVDGAIVQTINEPAAAEAAYTLRTVNLSAFANGAVRVIRFAYIRPAGTAGGDSFTIDDISLTSGVTPTPTPTVMPTPTPTPTSSNRADFDFDGDRKSDVSVFRPSNGIWYLNQSSAGFGGMQFGASTDKLAPADYDGDGRTDVAVFRNGIWYRLRSSTGTFDSVNFGITGDLTAPSDFDGDGKADVALFRPSNGTWYYLRSLDGGSRAAQFGQNGDTPVIADFDGDGRSDFSIYRRGFWYHISSVDGQVRGAQFGATTDVPVTGDFDGDNRADLAVFRPNGGFWFWVNSSTNIFNAAQFGQQGDIPATADFDGDGKNDLAVYRSGIWFTRRSIDNGVTGLQFGAPTDIPIPAAYLP